MTDEPPIEPGALIGPPVPPKALNPAHAILVGAVLSAIVTLIGVTLNIRSSERLSNERGKRDAAVAEANSLKGKVGDLEKRLDDALAKIPAAVAGTSVAATGPQVTTIAPTPPSIVVIVNPAPVAPVVTNVPITTIVPRSSTVTTIPAPATTGSANSTSTAPSTSPSTTTSTSSTTLP